MLVKMNVSTNSEMGRMAATIGAVRGDGKEKWDSDSGRDIPHVPYPRRNGCLQEGVSGDNC